MPSRTIGVLAESNLRRVGRSASSGSLAIMRSMRSRTSLAASSRLVPHVNSITTELVPSLDELDTVSTPDTALTVSSMGLEISCSTSSGLASSYVVLIEIAG